VLDLSMAIKMIWHSEMTLDLVDLEEYLIVNEVKE
jgi:hypothetical protein